MNPNTLECSVSTYAKCGWILNNHFTANLLENLPVKEMWISVKVWQKYGQEIGRQFLAHSVYTVSRKKDPRLFSCNLSMRHWILIILAGKFRRK